MPHMLVKIECFNTKYLLSKKSIYPKTTMRDFYKKKRYPYSVNLHYATQIDLRRPMSPKNKVFFTLCLLQTASLMHASLVPSGDSQGSQKLAAARRSPVKDPTDDSLAAALLTSQAKDSRTTLPRSSSELSSDDDLLLGQFDGANTVPPAGDRDATLAEGTIAGPTSRRKKIAPTARLQAVRAEIADLERAIGALSTPDDASPSTATAAQKLAEQRRLQNVFELAKAKETTLEKSLALQALVAQTTRPGKAGHETPQRRSSTRPPATPAAPASEGSGRVATPTRRPATTPADIVTTDRSAALPEAAPKKFTQTDIDAARDAARQAAQTEAAGTIRRYQNALFAATTWAIVNTRAFTQHVWVPGLRWIGTKLAPTPKQS